MVTKQETKWTSQRNSPATSHPATPIHQSQPKTFRSPTTNPERKVLAIDFDGVVHSHLTPLPGRRMGPPIEGAREALERYEAAGHEIIIHSVWAHDEGAKTIAAWMEYYKIPYHQITNVKPKADWYIDDHAQHFTSWDQVKI